MTFFIPKDPLFIRVNIRIWSILDGSDIRYILNFLVRTRSKTFSPNLSVCRRLLRITFVLYSDIFKFNFLVIRRALITGAILLLCFEHVEVLDNSYL
jgi:hypothetical protein